VRLSLSPSMMDNGATAAATLAAAPELLQFLMTKACHKADPAIQRASNVSKRFLLMIEKKFS
jgi:hypothetical protein